MQKNEIAWRRTDYRPERTQRQLQCSLPCRARLNNQLAGGINAYRYVPNPTGWIDPLGLSTCPEADGCQTKPEEQIPLGAGKFYLGDPPKNTKGVPRSEFNSWKLQLRAWTKATSRAERGLPIYTSVDTKKNNIVHLEPAGAGRGYRPNKHDVNNPSFNPSMNGAEMKFREDGTPFTLFPVKE